ncbi:MAG: hypothetical protein NTV89_04825 [Proteobacteria bacterium]|nr:hypothetical protein [Pseudomonadota bacterium]
MGNDTYGIGSAPDVSMCPQIVLGRRVFSKNIILAKLKIFFYAPYQEVALGYRTKKGAVVVLFEHNPFNPMTLRVVRSCAFDANAILLKSTESRRRLLEAGFENVSSRYILFIPFRGWLFNGLDYRLGCIPLGAQYYAVGVK